MKEVYIEKWESGFYWIVDAKTGEGIDGFRMKYQAVDYCEQQEMKVIKKRH